MWWCLDQTATATRTSRPIHRGALAHPTLASLGFLSLRSTRQIYTPPRDRDRNTGGPFLALDFRMFRARETTRRRAALLSPFFLSSAHDTPSSSPPIGLPLHARLFFLISHFPYSAATARPRRVLRGKERASLPFGMRARTHMQVFCAGRTHTPKRGFLHTTSRLRNSDINHPASRVLPPAPASISFHRVLISGKHLFSPTME